ncbi:MAG: FAD-containing oxidoreductase [Bryobacterales bacterium]|jgi:pyruvate/2-oxoglutarate dehydrogenase complex dihydrolipoamide dehydrogenase (E3) component|nr:FAD-containing oxidoreductase [Bryobacterales bacterium]
MEEFDAIIVGAGQAGPSLAGRLTEAGWTVALVEKDLVGGTCVNTGCTPTKAMVASAKAAHTARQGAAYGFDPVKIEVDLKKVKARKDAIVEKSRDGVTSWLAGMPGGRLIRGAASFASATQIRVGDETLSAKHIFLNAGARPRIPDFPGIELVPYLTSTTILDLEELPSHLIVVGGSYVGLEFAQMFRRFGAEVTVVERSGKLLGHEDDDVAQGVRDALEAEGIVIRTEAECIRLESRNEQIAVHLSCGNGAPEAIGSHVLLAVGRQPNTDTLALERAGLAANSYGFIEVDDQLRTPVAGIWALGDCNGRGAFTHTSYNDFEIVAANLLDDANRRVTDRIPVSALYIDPPLARVGMNERQVRERGRPAMIGYRPMTKVSRAIEKGETHGFMKVLTDAETGHILGGTVFGVGGDEAIHCLLPAMYARQPFSLMTHSVHIHPTVAELIPTVFGELKPLT